MDEGVGVQHFQRHGDIQGLFKINAEKSRRFVDEKRTQAFSAAGERVVHRFAYAFFVAFGKGKKAVDFPVEAGGVLF